MIIRAPDSGSCVLSADINQQIMDILGTNGYRFSMRNLTVSDPGPSTLTDEIQGMVATRKAGTVYHQVVTDATSGLSALGTRASIDAYYEKTSATTYTPSYVWFFAGNVTGSSPLHFFAAGPTFGVNGTNYYYDQDLSGLTFSTGRKVMVVLDTGGANCRYWVNGVEGTSFTSATVNSPATFNITTYNGTACDIGEVFEIGFSQDAVGSEVELSSALNEMWQCY